MYGGVAVGVGTALCALQLGLTSIEYTPMIALFGIFGGIAPDIDHDQGRPIRILSQWSTLLIPPLLIYRIPYLHSDTPTLLCSWVLIAK